MKKKLAKISQIISKTEEQVEITVKKKIKVAEEQFKLKDKEVQVIEKAGKEYRVFTAGYKSAMPKSEEELKQETISQKILSYHEKFFLINGGFSQFEKIKQFIDQEITDVPNEVILTVLDQLFELKLIFKSFKIGKVIYYLFKDVELNAVEKKFIKFATNKKPLKKINFLKGLKWDEEKVLSTMKSLQEKGILRIESNNIIIPGIIQKM